MIIIKIYNKFQNNKHHDSYILGLCDNGKSDISISAIIFYRFISINDIIQ